jgi:hypothetical protein
MSQILDIIHEAFEKARAESAARRARIEAAWKAENDELAPTVDRNGRMHAPCEGYMMPDNVDFRGDYDGHVFGAGEYLPVPLTDEDDYFGGYNMNLSRFDYREKVKAALSDIEEVMTMCDRYGITVNHGKAWECGGAKVAYAYVTGIKRMVKAAVQAFEQVKPAEKVTAPEPEVYIGEGRMTVRGTIVQTKLQEVMQVSYYSPTHVYKMLVKTPEGAKLWGTLPSAVDPEYRGEIEFTATFTKGDNGMTWFKRPSKVKTF